VTTNFKVGDKVRMKIFKSEKDYNSQSNGRGWSYRTFKVNYTDRISTITAILFDGMIIVKPDQGYWPFQIEKVNILKTRLQLAKELIK
jgi:hypothetical protein